MRTIWQSLIWKEWHEHKWKFLSIVGALWGTAVLSLSQGGVDASGLAAGMVTMCVVPLAVFIGLGAAASERSRGTFAFTQSLPAPMWRVALVKFLAGLFILIAAVALTLPVFYVWNYVVKLIGLSTAIHPIQGPAIFENPYSSIFLMCAALAASLYIWSAAAGVNRKDEVSAGAVALAVMVGWYCALFLLGYMLFGLWDEAKSQPPVMRQIFPGVAAFGFSTALAGFMPAFGFLDTNREEISHWLWIRYFVLMITTATITHLALAGWYVRRFGRSVSLGVRSPQVATRQPSRLDWLGTPRRSPLTAVCWKQFRESGPLVLTGLAGAAGISLIWLLLGWSELHGHPKELAEDVSVIVVSFGYAIALIVGIGVCFYDVSPQLNTFWRSRPINADLWFWCKYATGLIVLVTALYVPLLLVVMMTHPDPSQLLFDEKALVFPVAHIATFAAAVATTCLVRHAVYGAILSIPMLYAGVVAVLLWFKVGGVFGFIANVPEGLRDLTPAQVAGGFLITFVFSTILAWLAMRNDWGRKSRY